MFQFFEGLESEITNDFIKKVKKQYKENKNKKTGQKIKCPWCKQEIIKRNIYHQFCTNKGKGNCKDSFWNHVSEKRILRVQKFKKENKKDK